MLSTVSIQKKVIYPSQLNATRQQQTTVYLFQFDCNKSIEVSIKLKTFCLLDICFFLAMFTP